MRNTPHIIVVITLSLSLAACQQGTPISSDTPTAQPSERSVTPEPVTNTPTQALTTAVMTMTNTPESTFNLPECAGQSAILFSASNSSLGGGTIEHLCAGETASTAILSYTPDYFPLGLDATSDGDILALFASLTKMKYLVMKPGWDAPSARLDGLAANRLNEPQWTMDQQHLVFIDYSETAQRLSVFNLSDQSVQPLHEADQIVDLDVSPDGAHILFSTAGNDHRIPPETMIADLVCDASSCMLVNLHLVNLHGIRPSWAEGGASIVSLDYDPDTSVYTIYLSDPEGRIKQAIPLSIHEEAYESIDHVVWTPEQYVLIGSSSGLLTKNLFGLNSETLALHQLTDFRDTYIGYLMAYAPTN